MGLSISTPAILFPAISLFFLAYTNRFLNIARLARELHGRYHEDNSELLYSQIQNLMKRLMLIRNMQILSVVSFLLCVVTIFMVYQGYVYLAGWVFAASLLTLMVSLLLSIYEIQLSIGAITIELNDILKKNKH